MGAATVAGTVGMVGGLVVELVPVKVFDVACGPAAYALARQDISACHAPALSWVLIGAVLFVAGLITLCVQHEAVMYAFAWSVVGLCVLGGVGFWLYLR
jgi:hypothetical protein